MRRISSSMAVATVALLLLAGCGRAHARLAPDAAAERDRLRSEWGIEPLEIRLTASGYLLDFRYRVVDPEKAGRFVKRSVTPVLIDEASGARFAVPTPAKLGPMRQTAVLPYRDRIYFIFFANPGRFLKPGAVVTVDLGLFKIRNLELR